MPSRHAVLSASSAARWIACPKSVALSKDFPNVSTSYAQEGTDAHELCEYKLRTFLGDKNLKDPTENLTYFNSEMEDCSEDYLNYIKSVINKQASENNPLCFYSVEQEVDFSRWVPDGFGTSDCLLLFENGELYVIDFKYGKGVEVSAENNKQMMLYALGAMELTGGIYDIKHVNMSIVQPRMSNTSEWQIDGKELLSWADEKLTEYARLAYNDEGEFKAGEHCRFCPARHECRARAMENLALARYDFQAPPLLSVDEIAEILGKIPKLTKWAEDINKYALNEAASGRVQYPGWKVVEGRSNRKYTDTKAVAQVVENAGENPYKAPELLGVTDMTKLLGKKKFDKLLGSLIEKPQGKPTLATTDDPRPEMKNSAEEDFSNFDENMEE